MKNIIRLILRYVPRTAMQRVANIFVPILGLIYLGRGKECPICGVKRRKFLPYGYVTQRPNALCPSCLSLERHRLLWLYLQRETTLFDNHPTLLHIAPEISLMKLIRADYKYVAERYKSADLDSPLADIHFDVQLIPLEANSFEVVICNHILEHVENDRLAMSELHRVMAHGGWGILLSPVEMDREVTFEDDTIVDKSERTRVFGQYDHRRIYGRDYAKRLADAGFDVKEVDYYAAISPEEREKFALTNEIIYLVKKR